MRIRFRSSDIWVLALLCVGLILLCPGSPHEAAFAGTRSADTFYRRLVQGRAPAWLREIPLGANLRARFRLFEVTG